MSKRKKEDEPLIQGFINRLTRWSRGRNPNAPSEGQVADVRTRARENALERPRNEWRHFSRLIVDDDDEYSRFVAPPKSAIIEAHSIHDDVKEILSQETLSAQDLRMLFHVLRRIS